MKHLLAVACALFAVGCEIFDDAGDSDAHAESEASAAVSPTETADQNDSDAHDDTEAPDGCRALINTAARGGLHDHNSLLRRETGYVVYDLRFQEANHAPSIDHAEGIALETGGEVFGLRLVPSTEPGFPVETLEARRIPDGEPARWLENDLASSPLPVSRAFPSFVSGPLHIDATVGDYIAFTQDERSRSGYNIAAIDSGTVYRDYLGGVVSADDGERVSLLDDPPGLADVEEDQLPSYLTPVEEGADEDRTTHGTAHDYSFSFTDRSEDTLGEPGELALGLRVCCGADTRMINQGPHRAVRLDANERREMFGAAPLSDDEQFVAGPGNCPDIAWNDPTGEPMHLQIRSDGEEPETLEMPGEPSWVLGVYWIEEAAPFDVDDLADWEFHDPQQHAEDARQRWSQGRQLSSEGDWQEAQRRFGRALLLSEEVDQPDRYEMAADYQWARFQVLRREEAGEPDFAQLARAGTSLESLIDEHASGDFADLRGRVLYTTGRAWQAADRPEQARAAYEESLQLRDNDVVRQHLEQLDDE